MADPQPTDGHLRIAHSVLEQIMMSMFSERQLRVLLFILRLSWGCGRHSAYIPRQKDFELCGVREFHIKQVLDWLIAADIIIRDGDYYQFNKDFDRWHVSRAFNYCPQRLTDLVSLNLKEPGQDLRELTEKASQNLPKTQEITYQKGKYVEPDLASPKESLNKYIYRDERFVDLSSGGSWGGAEIFPREAAEIWGKVLAEMHQKVNSANYRTWLDRTAGLGYQGTDFIVGASSSQVVDYLSANMRSLLEKTLIEVSHKDFNISFLVKASDTS